VAFVSLYTRTLPSFKNGTRFVLFTNTLNVDKHSVSVDRLQFLTYRTVRFADRKKPSTLKTLTKTKKQSSLIRNGVRIFLNSIYTLRVRNELRLERRMSGGRHSEYINQFSLGRRTIPSFLGDSSRRLYVRIRRRSNHSASIRSRNYVRRDVLRPEFQGGVNFK